MTITSKIRLFDELKSGYYLVQVKHRQELRAKANLEKQYFDVYLPLIKKYQKSSVTENKHVKSSLVALFPGYLFCRATPQGADLSKIRSTRGVIKLVKFGTEPTKIHEDIINSIKSRLKGVEAHLIEPHKFHAGDVVQILNGPFAHLNASVESLCRPLEGRESNEQRAFLLIELMGKLQRIQVEFSSIEKVA